MKTAINHFNQSCYRALNRFKKTTTPLQNPLGLTRQQQLNLIIVGIASATFLSMGGIFPSYVFKITCMAPVFYLMPCFLGKRSQVPTNPGVKNQIPREFLVLLTSNPTESCLIYPVFEEIVFRGIIQNGLHVAFCKLLPNVTFSLFGAHFSPATVLAMGIASAIFGATHKDAKNPASLSTPVRHAFKCFISFAYFFHSYGIGASIFAHSIHNTINCWVVRRSCGVY